jgi:hypothetical protein
MKYFNRWQKFEDMKNEKIGQGMLEEFHNILGEFKRKYLG